MYSPPPRDSHEKYSFVPIPPLRSGPHRPPLLLHCRPRPDLRYLGIRVVVHADRTLHALQIHRSSVSSSPPSSRRHPPLPPLPPSSPSSSSPPRRCQPLRFAQIVLSRSARHLAHHGGIIGALRLFGIALSSRGIDADVWRSWIERFSRRYQDALRVLRDQLN